MKIHEYQGKEILRQFGVPVPRGYPAFSVHEASEAAQKLGGPVWVVKAQIHAGGPGQGSGGAPGGSLGRGEKLAGGAPRLRRRRRSTCSGSSTPATWTPTRRWPRSAR